MPIPGTLCHLSRYLPKRESRLPEETRIFVFLDEGYKLFECFYFRTGVVAMPFQVCPLPKDLPEVLGFDISGLCHRVFHFLVWFSPNGTNFEYLHTLSLNAEGQVEFIADMRRAAFFDELPDYFFVFPGFEFAKH